MLLLITDFRTKTTLPLLKVKRSAPKIDPHFVTILAEAKNASYCFSYQYLTQMSKTKLK